MGREGDVRLLHRLCHGAHSLISGPHASHPHAGKLSQGERRFQDQEPWLVHEGENIADEPLQTTMSAAVPVPLSATGMKRVLEALRPAPGKFAASPGRRG